MATEPTRVADAPPQSSSQILDFSHFQRAERVSLRNVSGVSTPITELLAQSSSDTEERNGQKRRSKKLPSEESAPKRKKAKLNNSTSSTRANSQKSRAIVQHEASPQNGVPDTNFSTPIIFELQTTRCMNAKVPPNLPKCHGCVRRGAGDLCRFQNLRSFCRDPELGTCHMWGFAHFNHPRNSATTENHSLTFPSAWNEEPTPYHVTRIKSSIVQTLLPTLRQELEIFNNCQGKLSYLPREKDSRATCDYCLTSIFATSWLCRNCGRESCHDCVHTLEPTSNDGRPTRLQCFKSRNHTSSDHILVTRFQQNELQDAIAEMEGIINNPVPISHSTRSESSAFPGVAGPIGEPISNPGYGLHTLNQPNGFQDVIMDVEMMVANPSPNSYSIHPNSSPRVGALDEPLLNPSSSDLNLHAPKFSFAELTEEVFSPLWARAIPIHVTDVQLDLPWGPKHLTDKYGDQPCAIYDCQTEKSRASTVGGFFKLFTRPAQLDGRRQKESLKLKDWPPTTEFRKAFEAEYLDFVKHVPMPDYVRPDGRMNVASMFPEECVKPDLGPKMYNAQANFITAGSKGTTRLHMDMADALNIMPWAGNDPQDPSKPGCAVWDLFRPEDSDAIRDFIGEHILPPELKRKDPGFDPIHNQTVYLDASLLEKLKIEKGVKSYRIYQYANEAVFIPAGCAHQVCNLANCIKVAVDFVSPQNIMRCAKLTTEFRNLNMKLAWKEDVLQLKNMMWFSWLCCKHLESKWAAEKEGDPTVNHNGSPRSVSSGSETVASLNSYPSTS
ncbi:hypothetical protein DL96DRAFT_1590275 [Flagelloscypha sp. PMI_526]|nr:hypothetical protein DL96DRAFT_1590275 [Flagelloscypha sp. PMI_526]